jgi:hypothetical protein
MNLLERRGGPTTWRISKAVAMALLAIETMWGCAGMEYRPTIVEQRLGADTRVLFLTAETRMVMYNEKTGRYCAEPPPDVAQNILTSLQVAINASGGKLPADVGAEFSRAAASTAQSLLSRSQGLQMYRDGMYYLCQRFMNGVINQERYDHEAKELLTQTTNLVREEVTGATGGAGNQTPSPGRR